MKAQQACGAFSLATCQCTASATKWESGNLKADFSSSQAQGPLTGCAYSGSVLITNLTAGTFTFTGSPAPNTVQFVAIPGGSATLILNEQCCDPSTGEFVVRAVHSVATFGPLTTETIVAESRVDASSCCPCPSGSCVDAVQMAAQAEAQHARGSTTTSTSTTKPSPTTTKPGSTTTTTTGQGSGAQQGGGTTTTTLPASSVPQQPPGITGPTTTTTPTPPPSTSTTIPMVRVPGIGES